MHDAKQGKRRILVPCLAHQAFHNHFRFQNISCHNMDYVMYTFCCMFTLIYLGAKYTTQMPTLVKVLVIRDWILLVVVLKVLQLWAMRRAAKSRKAQWLSTSGRKHSCLLTIHVTTAGMSSCS